MEVIKSLRFYHIVFLMFSMSYMTIKIFIL
jgi:hypothetical protein